MGKKQVSIIENNTKAVELEVEGLNDLSEHVTNHTYSLSLFKEGTRKISNFNKTYYLGFDFDGDKTLLDGIADFKEYAHIIGTTRSHQLSKNGKAPADHYRVIVELEEPIEDTETFYATYQAALAMFNGADKACADPARQFYACKELVIVKSEGKKLPVVRPSVKTSRTVVLPKPQNGTLSKHPDIIGRTGAIDRGSPNKRTFKFLTSGAPRGKVHPELIQAIYDLKENGYSKEDCERMMGMVPAGIMDAKAWAQIDDIYDNNRKGKYGGNFEPVAYSESETWVLNEIDKLGLAASYSRVLFIGTENITREDVARLLRLERDRQYMRVVRNEQIYDILDQWIKEQRKKHLDEIKLKIAGVNPNGEQEVAKFVRALTGAEDPIVLTAIKHFIWLTKRKFFSHITTHHMMLVLRGSQGSGKTVAINKLLAPLAELAARPRGLGVVGDSRESRLFTDYFVCFFDEMSQAEKADIEMLKNIITSEIVEYRVLGTNDRERGTNNSTFIGASNKPLKEIIRDTTGARRFFEIITLDKCDWALLNSINYWAIWQSVSEKEPFAPISAVFEQVQAIQEESVRHISPVEEWIGEAGLVEVVNPDELKTSEWMGATEALNSFKSWYGQSMTVTYFGSALKKVRGVTFKRGAGGKIVYNIRLRKHQPTGEF